MRIKAMFMCIALTAFTMASISGCGATTKQDANSVETESEVTNEIENDIEGEGSQIIETYELGNTISNEFMEFTPEKIWMSYDLLPSNTSGSYYYIEGEENKKWFYLAGTFKNTGKNEYALLNGWNSYIEFVFDENYAFTADGIYFESTDSTEVVNGLSQQISPFESFRIYLAALVPDELLDQFETVSIHWGMLENFPSDISSDVYGIEDCDYIYQIEANENRDEVAAYDFAIALGNDPETAATIASGEYETSGVDTTEEGIYARAIEAEEKMFYGRAIRLFQKIENYKDSDEHINNIKEMVSGWNGTYNAESFEGAKYVLTLNDGIGTVNFENSNSTPFDVDMYGRIFEGETEVTLGFVITFDAENMDSEYLAATQDEYEKYDKYLFMGDSLVVADENNEYKYWNGMIK
ncbi:MAG: hypothetical protein Q4B73_02015 [Lachnospiraceae bacterium]|nr:hypothetical protein [Lachnospiraceae bacterium]